MTDLQSQRGCRPWWRAAPSAPLQSEEPPAWTASPSAHPDSTLHTVLHLFRGPQRTRPPVNRLTWGKRLFLTFSPANTLSQHIWLPGSASASSYLSFSSFSSRSSVQSALQTVETSVKLEEMPMSEWTKTHKHTYTEHKLSNTQNILVETWEGFRKAKFALLFFSYEI